MIQLLHTRRFGALALAAALAAPVCHAQSSAASYPTQPIRMIVPFAVGGPNDVMARVLGQRLTQETGQPVVIDNKAGAGGVIGTDAVAKSKPDGYTIGFVSAPFAMLPALQAKMPYDTMKDLVPVSKVADSPMLMMVPSDSRFKTAGELIEFARKNPGKLTYGSGGAGSTPHLTTELLAEVTGAKFMHVPYKGGGESIRALMGGEVDLLIDSITSTATPLASGRVRPLAIGQATRSTRLPNVPTFEEAGIKNFSVTHWVGVVAPAKTPPAVLATLNAQIVKSLRAPEVVQKLAELGATPVGSSTEEFQKFVADELKKWRTVVKTSNIQTQ
ncbi:Bug family tripartite tricarboxylate transporter substrate binding protein [Variovorax sp. YR566]|uniref:Bug family tripartite tricarboxylate transporter substrate binding protein n=1 Tax=Variovorax sp. YR566 TaxID=3450237 RepID=UPI003F8213FF